MGSPRRPRTRAFHPQFWVSIRTATPLRTPPPGSIQIDNYCSFPNLSADKILRVVDAALACILGDLRVGAERPRAVHGAVGEVRSDHHLRRFVFLGPLLQGT